MPRVSASTKLNLVKDSVKNPVNKAVITAVVVIGAVLLVLLAVTFISPLAFGKPYFVVYSANGEIFVGKASWFPKFSLTDAYIVQSGIPTPEGGGLQLVPLKDTPWSPKKLYFEEDQIIFYGPVDEGSNVAQALKSL